jgi:hypothetical protein
MKKIGLPDMDSPLKVIDLNGERVSRPLPIYLYNRYFNFVNRILGDWG